MMAGTTKQFLKDLPAQNKDNFKVYHQTPSCSQKTINTQHRNSIYPTTSDTQLGQRIVNESKPQVTLKYLRVRGGQFNSLSQNERNPAKRKRTNGAKVQQ